MAIVVLHVPTEKNYLLLGTGFGMWATDRPGFMGLGNPDGGNGSTVFVSNPSGKIMQFPIEELVVVSVDGRPPAEYLHSPRSDSLS